MTQKQDKNEYTEFKEPNCHQQQVFVALLQHHSVSTELYIEAALPVGIISVSTIVN